MRVSGQCCKDDLLVALFSCAEAASKNYQQEDSGLAKWIFRCAALEWV